MQGELATLESKINAILPPRYVGCFEEVPAASMGTAGLKYDKQGQVAWGEIWTTFCHLALAGGPPHRGSFLAAVSAAEASAHPADQAAVVAEIKRAIRLSANLVALDTEPPGWVCLRCHDDDMAAWLVRAIVAENVIARHEGEILFVPAGPSFRIEKEIKNVVVCVAKSCHYLLDHVEPEERPRGFTDDLIEPPLPEAIAAAPAKPASKRQSPNPPAGSACDAPAKKWRSGSNAQSSSKTSSPAAKPTRCSFRSTYTAFAANRMSASRQPSATPFASGNSAQAAGHKELWHGLLTVPFIAARFDAAPLQ
jgi:hypothetical protein